jgi:hypothetical protein
MPDGAQAGSGAGKGTGFASEMDGRKTNGNGMKSGSLP